MTMPDAVIFDWAGTTVDFGSTAPVEAFRSAFASFGIEVTSDEIRAPMGMLKRDHIKAMLGSPRIGRAFEDKYGRSPSGDDAEAIYARFEPSLMQGLPSHCDLKPGLLEAVSLLRSRSIRIGSTTGYTPQMMEVVARRAAEEGYQPDAVATAEDAGGRGRPWPYMIFANMERLGLSRVSGLIKIGDTASDMQEGRNAGAFTVGIAEGSSAAGCSASEWASLDEAGRAAALARASRTLYRAGADIVARSLFEMEGILEAYSCRMGGG
ncbi:MAG: phosphonoacetaldehyde hydrolase [Succinivibrio sp.]